MKRQNSAELLRNRVKSAVTDRGRRRALMRAMGLKSQGTITQWLNAEHNPSVDKLDSIAAFLGVRVADLFVVHESDGVTSHDTAPASNALPGDAHGTDAGLLRSQAALEAENAQLRISLDAIADELKKLAAVIKTRKAPRGKPRAG